MMPKMNIEKTMDDGMPNDSMVRIAMKRVKFKWLRDVYSSIVASMPGKKSNNVTKYGLTFNMGKLFCFMTAMLSYLVQADKTKYVDE